MQTIYHGKSWVTQASVCENSREVSEDDSDEQKCFCEDCGQLLEDETEETEICIECGLCERWFQCACEGLSCPPPPETNYKVPRVILVVNFVQ